MQLAHRNITFTLMQNSIILIDNHLAAKQKVVPEIYDYMILTVLTVLTYKQTTYVLYCYDYYHEG
jgi:hypothetical protein